MKAIKTGQNKKGAKFAIVESLKEIVTADKHIVKTDEKQYAVYKLCENYAGHVRGGIATTWRYLEKGLTLQAAESLFNKKVS